MTEVLDALLIPADLYELRPMDGSPSITALFTNLHYVRLVFVHEDAPEFARPVPATEWTAERNRDRMAAMLDESARAVRDAVEGRLKSARQMDRHYDHPILMLQHLIWHDGYHHGQIKLALKLAGRPISDDDAGSGTWGIWMKKA
jgi:uncharacterized damage-inducible protein DinB